MIADHDVFGAYNTMQTPIAHIGVIFSYLDPASYANFHSTSRELRRIGDMSSLHELSISRISNYADDIHYTYLRANVDLTIVKWVSRIQAFNLDMPNISSYRDELITLFSAMTTLKRLDLYKDGALIGGGCTGSCMNQNRYYTIFHIDHLTQLEELEWRDAAPGLVVFPETLRRVRFRVSAGCERYVLPSTLETLAVTDDVLDEKSYLILLQTLPNIRSLTLGKVYHHKCSPDLTIHPGLIPSIITSLCVPRFHPDFNTSFPNITNLKCYWTEDLGNILTCFPNLTKLGLRLPGRECLCYIDATMPCTPLLDKNYLCMTHLKHLTELVLYVDINAHRHDIGPFVHDLHVISSLRKLTVVTYGDTCCSVDVDSHTYTYGHVISSYVSDRISMSVRQCCRASMYRCRHDHIID